MSHVCVRARVCIICNAKSARREVMNGGRWTKERKEQWAKSVKTSWNTTENADCWIRSDRLCLRVFYGVLWWNNSKNPWYPQCTAFLTNTAKIRIFMERWKISTSWIPCKLMCHFKSVYDIQNILCIDLVFAYINIFAQLFLYVSLEFQMLLDLNSDWNL